MATGPANSRDRRRLVACANTAPRSLIEPVHELSPEQYDEMLEHVIGLLGEIWALRVGGASVTWEERAA
jgi:hypothetical protein